MESIELVDSAKFYLNQYKSAQDRSFDSYLSFMMHADGSEYWQLPQEGIVKINTDDVLFERAHRYSYSMIVRDHAGQIVEAIVTCKHKNPNPVLVETIGIRDFLSWIKNNGWSSVLFNRLFSSDPSNTMLVYESLVFG